MSGRKVGAVLLWMAACSAQGGGGFTPTPTDGGLADQLPIGDSAPMGDCPADVTPSRAASERCCPAFGADACGAGLFCAALDGRTIPTCYPERSRAVGASCTANNQCVSGGCSTARMVCQPQLRSQCDLAIGCAPNGAQRTVCAGGLDQRDPVPPQCTTLGGGGVCEPCETSADCRMQGDVPTICNERHRCAFPANTREEVPRLASGCSDTCCAGAQEGLCSTSARGCFCICANP